MKEKIVAKKYAVALFEVLNSSDLESSLEQVKIFSDAISANLDFFANPSISAKNKQEVLKEVLGSFPQLLQNFFCVLLENSRFELLPEITEIFQALVFEYMKSLELEVVSAELLTEQQKAEIIKEIHSSVNAKAVVKFSIDSGLIAGYQIRCVDRVLDYSANRILDEAKRFLTK